VIDALTLLRRRIETAGGDAHSVRIVAVTKGFGPDAVLAARQAGLADVGENYAQELVRKRRELGPDAEDLRWHFLGTVQRNKVRALAPVVDCWQGLGRLVEGAEIARRRPAACVFVEVDTTGAPNRGGCQPAEVPDLVAGLRELGLVVEGLMTVAPPRIDAARQCFRAVRELADDLGLIERSMGMSDDLEVAVAEGSTMVRVGRALFGNRPTRSVIA
jgi:hypothetical protein